MTEVLPTNVPAPVGEVPAFGQAELEALYAKLGVQPHPILKLPTLDQVRGLLAQAQGRERLVEHLRKRSERIDLATQDPLHWTFEPETWRDADALLAGKYGVCRALGIYGGNRAQKTWYAVNRAAITADTFPGTRVLLLTETLPLSVATLQVLFWFYLKPKYGHLNSKRDEVRKISYSQSNGFTNNKLVLPNGSEVYFPTYNQDPGDWESLEYGAPMEIYQKIAEQLRVEGKYVPPNVGAVADESMPLAWFTMLHRRLEFRGAKLLWPFTPVKGITPAIKEMVGPAAQTLESRPSELLPRKNLPDCPEGQMPYIRRCTFKESMAIYFHTIFNKFGPAPGRTYYDAIKQVCEGKASELIERVAYGYARDSAERLFKHFGAWNVVKHSQLPAEGTNYFFTDPAMRNWMTIWVRVTAGNPPSRYIYRDWPDEQRYGEWAVPTERETNEATTRGWDGDPGPAQNGLGYGVLAYKRLFLEEERIAVPAALKASAGKWSETELDEFLAKQDLDPQHARRIKRAYFRKENLDKLQEEIEARYVDPRAGEADHMTEHGATNIIEQFEAEQKDAKSGKVLGLSMELVQASGAKTVHGYTALNDLLEWDPTQPLTPVLNQPHLFVSERCRQIIWMFQNYTGRGGEKGAAKDPADLCRYMALQDLEHVTGDRRGKAGRGW